jgi:trypsin
MINNQWVLTAAHCMSGMLRATVHIGVHNETEQSPQIRNIDKIIMHPEYEIPPRYVNDIALLHLESPVSLTEPSNHVGLACLPPKGAGLEYPTANTSLAVIGWGRLLSNGIRPTVLRQVRVKALQNNDSRCLGSVKNIEKQFCAMVDGGGKDACQGKQKTRYLFNSYQLHCTILCFRR